LENIEKTVTDYRQGLAYMQEVEKMVEEQQRMAEASGGQEKLRRGFYLQNKEYFDELLDVVETDDIIDVFDDVTKFATLTMKLAIDEMKFLLAWFENLRDELIAERK